jgi:nicotinamidase-related amidase
MPSLALKDLVASDHTALLIQEVQNSVVGAGSALPALAQAANEVGIFENLRSLAIAARASGIPVIHATAENLPGGFGSNHNARLFAGARKAGAHNAAGSEAVEPVTAIGAADGDIVYPRYHGLSPLTGAQLDSLLRNAGVTTLVVTGVSLNIAIPNVVFDAVNRSYQVVVVTDAVAGVPVEYGKAVVANTLSLLATLVTTQDLIDTWA